MSNSKVYKGFQTVIPSKIRKDLGIKEEDSLKWESNGKEATVRIDEQRSLDDLTGLITLPYKTDSVDLKKKSSRGEI